MAMIFLADPEQGVESSESRLRALFEMTGTEAKVGGSSRREAASRPLPGLGDRTVDRPDTHLHRAFDKTGTRRQAELARLVNQIAALSGPLGK
jgi:hypothetical protein